MLICVTNYWIETEPSTMRSPSLETPNSRRALRTVTAIAMAIAICKGASAEQAPAQNRRFDCVIDPSMAVKLGSPTTGLIADVLVDRGDIVAEGQVVARLEVERRGRDAGIEPGPRGERVARRGPGGAADAQPGAHGARARIIRAEQLHAR